MKKSLSFRLATEMDEAGKFDDVVLEYKKPNGSKSFIFLQGKHTQEENENKTKITSAGLMDKKDGNFALHKYFKSYQKIQRHQRFGRTIPKYFIINTNIGFGFDSIDSEPGLKKVDELYFELFVARDVEELKLVNVDGEYYKFVSSEYSAVIRKQVVDTLNTLFKETSDCQRLAEILAEHLVKNENINFRNALCNKYQIALVKEVFHTEAGKLAKTFLDGDRTLSSKAKSFRITLLKALEKVVPTQIISVDDFIKTHKLYLSSPFKDVIVIKENSTFSNVKQFAKNLAQHIVNSSSMKDVCILRKHKSLVL